MKRLLYIGLTLIALGGVFTSCSKKDLYDPEKPAEDAKTKYEKAFLAYIGGSVDSRQDWGFNATVRSKKNATRTEGTGYYLSDSFDKEYTKDFYDTALDSLPEGKAVGQSIKNFEFISRGPFRFDIIFSYTTEAVEMGYYYYDPETQSPADRKEVRLVGNIIEDLKNNNYFQYTIFSQPSETQWETPPAARGYKIWTPFEAKKVHARMFTLRVEDVPVGNRVGFYVKNPKDAGETTYTNKYLNKDEKSFFAVLDAKSGALENAYVVGMEDRASAATCDDFDCNDVMLAVHKNVETTFPLLVIPEKPKATAWRIIAEDLNVHDLNNDGVKDDTDFDFNDIVLDVTLTDDGAVCILQAAGATLQIRINGDPNLEVHKMFGVAQDVMVNTHAEKRGLKYADKDPYKFSLKGNFQSANDIKIEVFRDNVWVELTAPVGRAASKIAVGTDFEWPDERQSLKEKYPDFPSYAKDYINVDTWWKRVAQK